MTKQRLSIALFATVVVAASAHAADPVKLTKEQAQQALSGKSINYASREGRPVIIFFAANGNVSRRSGNATPSTGTWAVEDDGRFCIKITNGTAPNMCRHLIRTDAGMTMSDAKGENVTAIDGLE